jgi:hypothetical protein
MRKSVVISAALAVLLCPPLLLAQLGSTSVAPVPASQAQATDANGDSKLSKSELTPGTRIAQRFEALDLNHDGVLTRKRVHRPVQLRRSSVRPQESGDGRNGNRHG